MNPTQETPPAVVAEPVAEAMPRRQLTAHFDINLALIMATLSLLLLAGHWLMQRRETDELRIRIAEAVSTTVSTVNSIKQMENQNSARLQSTGDRLAVLESKLAEAQSQQDALNSMYQALAHSREDWLVAEAEQTLMLAHQQLQLAGNVPAALTALQVLDQRLAEMSGPKLTRLRASLAVDIAALKNLPYVDPADLAKRLDSLLQRVDTLPLQIDHIRSEPLDEQQAAGSPEKLSLAQRLGRELWGAVSTLIVVRRIDQTDPAVLGPENSFFVRENLKLRLGDARLTLLQRNTALFQSDIAAARDTLGRYFDARDRRVQTTQQELQRLQTVRLHSELVDLNNTIALARDLLRSADTMAAPAVPASGVRPAAAPKEVK